MDQILIGIIALLSFSAGLLLVAVVVETLIERWKKKRGREGK